MDIHDAARRHGVDDTDIRHAVRHYVYVADVDADGEARVLYLGPDRAANLLEVVVVERDDGSELAIHAMKMRPRFARLLP